jgi:hypothetical protein
VRARRESLGFVEGPWRDDVGKGSFSDLQLDKSAGTVNGLVFNRTHGIQPQELLTPQRSVFRGDHLKRSRFGLAD